MVWLSAHTAVRGKELNVLLPLGGADGAAVAVGQCLHCGLRGKGGGYRLAKTPADYSAGEIIRLAEGSLASVSCLKGEKKGCEKAGHCRALPLWQGLDQMIDQYLDSYSLADLQKQQAEMLKQQQERQKRH